MKLFEQNRCLNCHNVITPSIGWGTIFSIEKKSLLCLECEGKLEKVEGETCRICNRPFRLLNEKYRNHDLCHDCYRWEEDLEWKGFLEANHSLFLYNDFLKGLIASYKFRGDYVLAKVFQEGIKEWLWKLAPDLVVPIPLSEERLYERGFNQASALISEAGFSPADILSRIHSEKQSKKSRSDRIHLSQVFNIESSTSLKEKKIVLVDDIYTTGSTLRHAAKLLKSAGAASIQSLTIAR